MEMIQINNLNKNFKNRKLFNDFNLEIPENKLVFIVGPSGSGKTTLLHMISNITKVDSGKIIYNKNNESYSLQDNKTPIKVGIIFQNFNLLNNISSFDNVQIAHLINGTKAKKEYIDNYFDAFDLKNEKKILSRKLSVGQQQRISFLRALSLKSDILIADEPTGNLDSENKNKVFKELKKISKNKTVIVVSHDLESASKYADLIFHLKDGNLVDTEKFDDNIDDFQYDENLMNNNTNKTSIKYKFFVLPKLMLNDLRKNKINLILFLFSLVFSLIFLFFIFLFNISNKNLTLQNNSFLENDKVFITKKDNSFFTQEEINKFDKFPKEVNEVVKLNSLIKNNILFQYKNNIFPITEDVKNKFEQINFSTFFEKRIGWNQENIKVINKDFISNENGIIISQDLANSINYKQEENSNLSIIHLNSKIDLKVLGINNGKDLNSKVKTYINAMVFKNLLSQSSNSMKINEIVLYAKKVSEVEKLTNDLKEIDKNFFVTNNLNNITKIVNDNSKNINNLTILFFILISLMTFLIFLFYLKFVLNSKKKEMGILKILGASKKQIILYHLAHIFLIAILSLVGILILFEPSQLLFNYVLKVREFFSPSLNQKIAAIFAAWSIVNSIIIIIYLVASYKLLKIEVSKLFKF
ncbi:ABC transporter ATP-binding protein/permease [Mycoplasmopsis pulmonis]|uniref:ABC transporter ATP-binding protein/permease n=2 Tax=Mycoplasmopsis pulmonis TaxID=2107 RepID=UPI00101C93B6|nr:ATP-binding cassette domain-containing protein [Mycoplasmopsis pulmonis]